MTAATTREDLKPQEQRLLDVILDVTGTQFDNSHENWADIRQEMGCSQPVLRALMHSLQEQGFLRREVRCGNPRFWVVSPKGVGARAPELIIGG